MAADRHEAIGCEATPRLLDRAGASAAHLEIGVGDHHAAVEVVDADREAGIAAADHEAAVEAGIHRERAAGLSDAARRLGVRKEARAHEEAACRFHRDLSTVLQQERARRRVDRVARVADVEIGGRRQAAAGADHERGILGEDGADARILRGPHRPTDLERAPLDEQGAVDGRRAVEPERAVAILGQARGRHRPAEGEPCGSIDGGPDGVQGGDRGVDPVIPREAVEGGLSSRNGVEPETAAGDHEAAWAREIEGPDGAAGGVDLHGAAGGRAVAEGGYVADAVGYGRVPPVAGGGPGIARAAPPVGAHFRQARPAGLRPEELPQTEGRAAQRIAVVVVVAEILPAAITDPLEVPRSDLPAGVVEKERAPAIPQVDAVLVVEGAGGVRAAAHPDLVGAVDPRAAAPCIHEQVVVVVLPQKGGGLERAAPAAGAGVVRHHRADRAWQRLAR